MIRFLIALYIFVVALFAVAFTLIIAKATSMFKSKHPGFVGEKMFWADKVNSIMKLVLMMLCPLLNMVFAYTVIVKYDELCVEIVQSMENRYQLNTK